MNTQFAEKLESERGLIISVAHTDDERAQIICLIVNWYAAGVPMEMQERCGVAWTRCENLPCNFENHHFRVAQ